MIMIVCYQEQKTKQTKPQNLDFLQEPGHFIMGCMEIGSILIRFFPGRMRGTRC